MKIVILGIGGGGSWLGMFFATTLLAGDTLTLIDNDKLEEDNLRRVPFPKNRAGDLKVDVAKDFLSPLAYCQIETIAERFPSSRTELALQSASIVFDCTDNTATKKAVAAFLNPKIPLYRLGADGYDYMVDGRRTVYWGEQNGYNVVSHADVVMFTAALAAHIATSPNCVNRSIKVVGEMKELAKEKGKETKHGKK
jgi:molybdopterin/thiamine biosynthesis adenylyltransferase